MKISKLQSLFLFFMIITAIGIFQSSSATALSTQDIADRITGALNTQVTLPHPGYVTLPAGHDRVGLWLVIAVFAMLFSILYVLTLKLSIFKKDGGEPHKGAVIVFASAVTFIVIFASSFIEQVAKMAGALANLAALAMFILAIILLWYYSSSAYHAGKTAAMESGTKSATAKKALAAAQQDEKKALHDLDITKKLMDKEQSDLNVARHKLHSAHIDEKNEVKALQQVLSIIQHLNSVSTEQAKKLKQAYQRQLAVLSALIQHEARNLTEYHKRINHIAQLGHPLLREANDEAAKINEIITEMKAARGMTGMHTAAHAARAQRIAREALRLNAKHAALVHSLQQEITGVAAEDKKANDEIRSVIGALHSDNYPAALHHIHEAIRLKKHIDTQFSHAEHFDAELAKLESRQKTLNAALARFIKHAV